MIFERPNGCVPIELSKAYELCDCRLLLRAVNCRHRGLVFVCDPGRQFAIAGLVGLWHSGTTSKSYEATRYRAGQGQVIAAKTRVRVRVRVRQYTVSACTQLNCGGLEFVASNVTHLEAAIGAEPPTTATHQRPLLWYLCPASDLKRRLLRNECECECMGRRE